MKILIVDDEHVEIEALNYILSGSDLPLDEILTANNGRKAIEAAKIHRPDIVLMDIKMPGISGTEAAAAIKDLQPDCHIVFLSAYNYFDYAQEAIRLKASDFLIKPIADDELISLVTGLIQTIEKDRQNQSMNSNIESQFRQISSFFENELINYVLFADVKEQQLREYFQTLGCRPASIHTLTVMIDDHQMTGYSSLKANMVKGRLLKTIKESLLRNADHVFGNFQKNWLYFLIMAKEPWTGADSQAHLMELHRLLTDKFDIKCQLTVSPATDDLMTLNARILAGKQAILFNTEAPVLVFPQKTLGTGGDFSPKKEQMLLESLRLNNKAMILALADEFSLWLHKSDASLTKRKFRLIGLFAYLTKSLKDDYPALTGGLEHLTDGYMHRLETCENPETLTACFTDQLMNISQLLTSDRPDPDSPVVHRLCRYIDDNYMLDLSLSTMAEDLSMNGQYLSKLFKTEKGVTFSDYLSDVRISHAKKLLAETNDTIQDIGLSVGYNDPNYFTRAFKKHEALTPKQYRIKASML